MNSVVAPLMQSLFTSALLTALSCDLIVRVFAQEHAQSLQRVGAYTQYSFEERAAFIFWNGRFVSKIVLAASVFGIHEGSQFLGKDLQYAWGLLHQYLVG